MCAPFRGCYFAPPFVWQEKMVLRSWCSIVVRIVDFLKTRGSPGCYERNKKLSNFAKMGALPGITTRN